MHLCDADRGGEGGHLLLLTVRQGDAHTVSDREAHGSSTPAMGNMGHVEDGGWNKILFFTRQQQLLKQHLLADA